METHNNNEVNPMSPVSASEHAARGRNALGLSPYKQIVYLPMHDLPIRQRFNKLKRVVTGAAKQITDGLQQRGFRYRAAFITTTYRPGQHWEPRDISKLLDHYRQWLKTRGHRLQAVWVMELHKSGVPHYHLVIWLPRGLTPPKPDKQGWWKKGMTNCKWARNPVRYLAKYASKGGAAVYDIPKGARLHGIYGCDTPLGWYRAPGWLRELTDPGNKIMCRPGGWWCVYDIGRAIHSPWRVQEIVEGHLMMWWVGWSENDVKDISELEAAGVIKPCREPARQQEARLAA